MAEQKNVLRPGRYILRAAQNHPMRRFRILRHEIGANWAEYDLNADEAKDLSGPGPQKWVQIGKPEDLAAQQKMQEREKPAAQGKAPAQAMAEKIKASEQQKPASK